VARVLADPVPEHDVAVPAVPEPAACGTCSPVSTYATVSALFWYVGLIPDLATLRDRAKSKPWKILYGILAMGWRGAARHWELLRDGVPAARGLATPLVISCTRS
jgi:hypothetical protein